MPQLPTPPQNNAEKVENITSSKLLLVEGKDEAVFCRALLQSLTINDVQIINIGGSQKFSSNIERLPKRQGFKEVTMLGILRDAEINPAKSTFDSVCSDLKRINLPVPTGLKWFSDTSPQIGVFIMPDNNRSGMLEDLCLESLSGTDESKHTDTFFMQANVTATAKDFAKRRVQAWFSIFKTNDDLQCEVGRAAEAGFWNFDHPCFDGLKAFLKQFR